MTSMVTPAHPSAFYLRDSYELSFVVSIFFHALLLLLLFYGWSYRSKDQLIVTPQYVQARLVKMTAQSVITKQEPVKEEIQKPIAKEEPIIIRPLQHEVIQPPKESKNQLQQKKLKEEKLKQEKLKQEQEKQEQLERQQQQTQAEQAAKEKAEAEKRKADQALAKEMAD